MSQDQAKHQVVQMFFLGLCFVYDRYVGKKNQFRRIFLNHLKAFGLNWKSEEIIEKWIRTNSKEIDFSDLSIDDLTSVVDGIYTFLCEQFGPVLSDKMISEVVSKVEKHPASSEFSIRKLL